MRSGLFPGAGLKSVGLPAWLVILALPLTLLVASLVMRGHAGPFWLWSNLDPDYWYLLDSLNIINLDWPAHIAHPGTPLQVLGAMVIKAAHPFAPAEEITRMVLEAPETYLRLIFLALLGLITLAHIFAGLCAYLVFSDRLAVVLVQLGPFISKLSLKWLTHVAPEPLLVGVVLVLGGVALLALQPGVFAKHRLRFAVVFGLIAGFGMATKITSVGIYFLPVLLLWGPATLATYAATALAAFVLFTLPAAGSYGDILAHINNISVGSPTLGEVRKPFIDMAQYPAQFIRVSSRPAFFVVFVLSLAVVLYLAFQSRARGRPFPLIGRLLAGLCLADLVQALIVAKHPSGHYMIPVLVLSTLGLALIYGALVDVLKDAGRPTRPLRALFGLLCAALMVAQGLAGVKLDRQFQQRAKAATSLDDGRFDSCARIYFWSAASPSYALLLGDHMVGNPFARQLESRRPGNDFWYEILGKQFRDWRSPRDISDIAGRFPCIYARGTQPQHIRPALQRLLPSHTFSARCTPPDGEETILTWGVDCQGNPQ